MTPTTPSSTIPISLDNIAAAPVGDGDGAGVLGLGPLDELLELGGVGLGAGVVTVLTGAVT